MSNRASAPYKNIHVSISIDISSSDYRTIRRNYRCTWIKAKYSLPIVEVNSILVFRCIGQKFSTPRNQVQVQVLVPIHIKKENSSEFLRNRFSSREQWLLSKSTILVLAVPNRSKSSRRANYEIFSSISIQISNREGWSKLRKLMRKCSLQVVINLIGFLVNKINPQSG